MARSDYDDDYDDEEDQELVLFQGALNGVEANLRANARLAQAGLLPAKELVSDGLARHAEMILIEPKGDRAMVKLIIDGVAYPGGRLPGRRALAIIQMLKLLSGLDIQERRQPQMGGVKAEFSENAYRLMVDTTPAPGGLERLRIRVVDLSHPLTKPGDIGMPDELKEKIRKATGANDGVLLVCGPPGSGVSTLTHVVLHTVDCYLYSVFSIADTEGRETTNVSLFEPNPDDDLTTTIMRMRRKEADVIYVDPITAETAPVIFEHQDDVAFLAEIRANAPELAVQQVADWFGDPQPVIAGLKGVITQKLVRKLCEKCREAYRPNRKLMARVGLPPETKVLYREPPPPDPEDDEEPEICEHCDGIGYRGRVAAFEMLELSDGMKELVAENAGPAAYRKQMREEGMLTLQFDALRLVAEGKTSLEELQRAFAPKRKKRPRRR